MLQSKDFASFNRPHLTCTGVICHGYSALLCVSETHISADSSRTTEIIMHTLQRLQSNLKVDLRACQLVVQSDNCSKEGKNNTLLRTLSGLVASRRLARAELNFLESGHSHEAPSHGVPESMGFVGHNSAAEGFQSLVNFNQ